MVLTVNIMGQKIKRNGRAVGINMTVGILDEQYDTRVKKALIYILYHPDYVFGFEWDLIDHLSQCFRRYTVLEADKIKGIYFRTRRNMKKENEK